MAKTKTKAAPKSVSKASKAKTKPAKAAPASKANASSSSKAKKAPAPSKPKAVKTPVATSKPFEPETKASAASKKPSLIETESTEMDEMDGEFDHDPVWETIEKVAFADMCNVLHALSDAFMPHPEHKPNDRFKGAWLGSLAIAGWSEEDFWTSYECDDACPVCGGDLNDDEDDLPLLKASPDKLAN